MLPLCSEEYYTVIRLVIVGFSETSVNSTRLRGVTSQKIVLLIGNSHENHKSDVLYCGRKKPFDLVNSENTK
jgi:hypothetical protein